MIKTHVFFSQEQVVPSSQISGGAKNLEDTNKLDNGVTNGDLVQDIALYNVTTNDNVYDSQPP